MAKSKKVAATLTPEEKLQQALVPVEEQPYEIPDNWTYVNLQGITTKLKRGKAPKYVEKSEILVFAQKCNQKDGTIAMEKAKFLNPERVLKIADEDFLKDKDVVINSTGTGTLGRVGYYREAFAYPYKKVLPDSHVTVVRALDCVDQHYMYYFLKSKQENLELQGAGSTNQKELRPETIGATIFPLPPLGEQQRIVDRIESIFAKLDEAKEKAQAVVDGFELRKSAILHKAFTGELTAQWRKEHGVERDSWEKTTLGELTDITSSKRIYKDEYVESGIPFFRSSEVVDLYDNGVTNPVYFITEARYEEIKKQYGVPQKGDLLVTSVGTIGKTWIVDDRKFYYKDGNLTQVKQCEKMEMPFLQFFIMSPEFNYQVIDTVSGSAYNALTIVKFKKIEINLPSNEEQQEIARALNKILFEMQQAKEAAETVIDQIDTMKKAVLARAFRGELGTNDPAEESAIELLKEVLNG